MNYLATNSQKRRAWVTVRQTNRNHNFLNYVQLCIKESFYDMKIYNNV